uniref:Uncharacterized protein n=1 Tax=Caenorhabditis japonica TaxID=281687 RepID=A0A8R1IU36_CAEJA
MTTVNGRCSAMPEHLTALESELGAQRARLENLKRKMKETPETTKLATTDFKTEERKRSIVAINIPEGGSRLAHDNNKMDIEKVSLILKHLDIGYQLNAVYRMGKTRDDGRPRLIKIILPCSASQMEIMRRARRLRSFPTGQCPPVYLRPSMTKEEREKFWMEWIQRRQSRRNSQDTQHKSNNSTADTVIM